MKTALYAASAAALAAALTAGPAVAANKADLAREAISLEKAVATVSAQHPNARIVEAELEDEAGGLWELKLLGADGKSQKVYLDARTGEPRDYRDK